MPLSIFFIVVLAAVALLFSRWWRLGRGVLVAALLALWVLSWEPTARLLLAPLERAYPALVEVRQLPSGEGGNGYIVVLGHGHRLDPRLVITSQVSSTAAVRLLEGLRIQRRWPQSQLILSGGAAFGSTPNSAMMYRLAQALGMGRDSLPIVRFESPRNTREEALRVAQFLRDKGESAANANLVLVTEASHMPRAMALFKGVGLDPIAAPTRHRVREHEPGHGLHPGDVRPSANALRMSERAIHEYVGLLWAYLRGWTP